MNQTAWRQNDRRWDFLCCCVLVAAAFGFLLVFSRYTSPLYPDLYGDDAAYFILTGRQVAHGAVPYLDFFDVKGPFLFFIEALGQATIGGRSGAFAVQFPFLCATFLLCFYVARTFLPRQAAVTAVILVIALLTATFEGGNLTEEFSLPLVLLPLLLACRVVKKGAPHPPVYGLIDGICLTLLALIRLTNAAVLLGILLFFLIDLIARREIRQLLQNVVAVILGMLAAAIPFGIYFAAHGAFREMIYGTFGLPFFYAQRGVSDRNAGAWSNVLHYLLPAWSGVAVGLLYQAKKSRPLGWLLVAIGGVSVAAFWSGKGYLHYFTMTAPVFLLAAVFCFDLAYTALQHRGEKPKPRASHFGLMAFAGVILFVCVYFYVPIIDANITQTINYGQQQEQIQKDDKEVREQGALIPASQRNEVWGYEVPARWFCITGIDPLGPYSAYQQSQATLDPKIGEAIDQMLTTNPPKWIAVRSDKLKYEPTLQRVLSKSYTLVSNKQGIQLHRRNT